jgi:hypothetical protein
MWPIHCPNAQSSARYASTARTDVATEKPIRISIAFFICADSEPNSSDDSGFVAGRRPELKQPSRSEPIASNAQRSRFFALPLSLSSSDEQTFEFGSSARQSDGAHGTDVPSFVCLLP